MLVHWRVGDCVLHQCVIGPWVSTLLFGPVNWVCNARACQVVGVVLLVCYRCVASCRLLRSFTGFPPG
eukprot:12175896-Alexandrium_andersonii.AAC.1